MTFSRLQTSQSRLRIRWQHAPDEQSIHVGTLADALYYMSDRSGGKPILINRETDKRDPKVAQLYKAALDSERFSLASHWFHCVKVGDEVLSEHHPLNPLFAANHPPALVMVSADGKKSVSFLGTKRQKVKWTPIAGILKATYKKNPTTAVKGLEKLLCKFDAIDGKQNELNTQLARAETKQDKSKIAAIKKKLEASEKEREQAYAEEAKLRELVLRNTASED